MIKHDLLWELRNRLPMPVTIRKMGEGGPYSKFIEGYIRFECPKCHNLRATINPKNNLAHCFCCEENINNIDLLMWYGYDFKSAAATLVKWLNDYKSENPQYFKET
jgi:hypothetical protein